MIENLKRGINALIYIVQLLFIAVAFLMQYFSSRRMGMYRYLVYKNQKLGGCFTPEMMLVYQIILGLVFLFSCLLFLNTRGKMRKITLDFTLLIFFIAGAFYFSLKSISDFKALYYLFISFASNVVVQLIRIFSARFRLNKE